MSTVPSLIVQNLRLPGQEFDVDTGLYHNGFRDYVPGWGRYLQSDPIGLMGGLNTYGYAEGNPINQTDPLGLIDTQWWSDTWSGLKSTLGEGWDTVSNAMLNEWKEFSAYVLDPQGSGFGAWFRYEFPKAQGCIDKAQKWWETEGKPIKNFIVALIQLGEENPMGLLILIHDLAQDKPPAPSQQPRAAPQQQNPPANGQPGY